MVECTVASEMDLPSIGQKTYCSIPSFLFS